jgi:hypothetical protein
MKNLKVAIPARQLLVLVTPEVLFTHFKAQEEHLLARGRITRRVSAKRMRAYAQDCWQSYRRHLREAQTPRDLALVQQNLIQHIAHTKTDFLGAVWKGDKKSTIEFLN